MAQKPLDKLFNIGPFATPGGREIPNNLSSAIGPAPWAVSSGPSIRRVIDFADASKAMGINPVGQSGVLFDAHYQDQAKTFITGGYVPQHLSAADVKANTRSTLTLMPAKNIRAGTGGCDRLLTRHPANATPAQARPAAHRTTRSVCSPPGAGGHRASTDVRCG